MTNATPSRLGQVNAAGDPLALFLKVFSGEVLEAFDRESAFRSRHLVRQIASGKSAQFPVTGLATAQYHTPGAEILGQQIKANEKLISIEDMLVAPVFIANIDELQNHYDIRSIYANEIGQALAKRYDQNVARVIINASRNTAVVTGLPDGAHSNDADYDTDGTKLWAGVFNAGVQLDANDVPMNDRYAAFQPVQYALIVRSEKPINRDISPDNGSLKTGAVDMINSIPIFKTNNLIRSDDRTSTDQPTSRKKDYSVTRGIIFHRGAAGTVQLQDVTMESQYDMRRQGTLMLGKYLVGHGDLRAEAAYELRTGDPAA